MPSYRTVGRETTDLLDRVLRDYRPDLVEAGVTVQVLSAHAKRDNNGMAKGPALKLHGYACAATVSITSLKDRVAGLKDARIVVDGDTFPDRTPDEQIAIFDHELEHLVLVRDEEGAIVLDDANRPKLRLKPHDVEIGLFYSVVERHKTAAIEAQAYINLHRTMTQKAFPWG